jgi:integrase
MTSCSQPQMPSQAATVRSMPFDEWPEADRFAWTIVRRPAERLKRGGAASHMKDITCRDLARRYGYFLDYVQRTEGLDLTAAAAAYITPARVDGFLAELQARVRSVTVHGSIYKLRRMAQLLDPHRDFSWLVEIENDLAAAMQPQPKFGRFVYSHVLIKVGTDLMTKAEAAMHRSALARARQFRNGLMVAMLGYHPLRPKNFAALELGLTFRLEFGSWWIVLPRSQTKEKRADERIVDSRLIPWIDRYLEVHRPVLARRLEASKALWLSSNNGRPLTICGVEDVISNTTLAAVGIRVSPHLFRTAAVSTAAVYAGNNPHLGSALLHHRDPRIREKHYNRASCLSATQSYSALVRALRKGSANQLGPEPW